MRDGKPSRLGLVRDSPHRLPAHLPTPYGLDITIGLSRSMDHGHRNCRLAFRRSSPGRRAPSPRRPCGRPLAAGLGVKRAGNISCCGPFFYSWSSLTPGPAAIRWPLKQDKWPWQMNKRSWRL